MSRRALLLINPHARRGEKTRLEIIERLEALGFELVEASTEDLAHLSDLILEHQGQVDLVIIGGGDGTVNAAVRGLIETRLPLGVLPLGTANNLARTLGLPQSLLQACDTIAHGRIQQIDVGWVNGRYFLNVAGIGISTHINRHVAAKMKRSWGVIAYIVTAFRLIWRYQRFYAEIRWNGKAIATQTFQITICNGRHYGNGMTVAADAAIDDQRLDLCSMEMQRWWHIFRVLPAMRRGEYATGRGIQTLRGREIEIHTLTPYPIDTDGEITTTTPARFCVLPRSLSVFVPTSKS